MIIEFLPSKPWRPKAAARAASRLLPAAVLGSALALALSAAPAKAQSLTEVFNSPQRDLLLESCRTKVFLPNPEARSSQTSQLYRKLGLNETQVELVAHAIPKRHYYYVSELGRRMLDLGLGPETLSFIGISGSEEIEQIRKLRHQHGASWPALWLEQRGLDEAALRWRTLNREYTHAS